MNAFKGAVGVATVIVALMWPPHDAQAQTADEPPPIRSNVDANGVDLIKGELMLSTQDVMIGQPGQGALTFGRLWHSGKWRHNHVGTIMQRTEGTVTTYTVSIGGASESYRLEGGAYTPAQGQGSSLTLSGNLYTYTSADGAVAIFDKNLTAVGNVGGSEAFIRSLTLPNGEKLTYHYVAAQPCIPTEGCGPEIIWRLQSVTNNLGYQLRLNYGLGGNQLFDNNQIYLWSTVEGVTGINMAVDYCDPTAYFCSGYTVSWPTVSYGSSPGQYTVTNNLGEVTTYSFTHVSRITGIRREGESQDHVSFAYDGQDRVSSVTRGSSQWTYSYQTGTTTVTDPNGLERKLVFNSSTSLPVSDTDGLGNTTSFQHDSFGRRTHITFSEGDAIRFAYDGRGNVTETRRISKTPGTPADIVTTASYDATCPASRVKCNKPNYTIDARGNRTDFTYDLTHGGVLTVTEPAVGGVRPQTRYTYTALQAYYMNAPGSIAASGENVHFVTSISTCRTTTACASTADEIRTVIGYGSSGVANNRLPQTTTVRDGTNALAAVTTRTYDDVGNVLTVDGPLPGPADTTRIHYDALRRVVGTVAPHPGVSGRPHVARRNTYNAAGFLTAVQTGTVAGQSDTHWTAFSAAQTATFTYDLAGRQTMRRVSANGSTYAMEQVSYDAGGRVDCVATRMNPAAFASPPSACSLGSEGNFGADRIVKYSYDAADRVVAVTSGFGAYGITERMTYTDNGRVETVTDGKGNRTTFEHDGFGRLVKTRFPHPTNVGSSSTTDYESLTYDEASNITSARLRNETIVAMSWDALNRMSVKDFPGTTAEDVYFRYDNHGRMLSARYGSTSGQGIVNTYDGLGRHESRTAFGRTLSYQYDIAGRRTRVTHPDGFYASYTYDTVGELAGITDSSGAQLASYQYDSLGRPTALARSNGGQTGFGWDSASRLDALSQTLPTSNYNSSATFDYAPSGQIISQTQNNPSAYLWTPPGPSGAVGYAYNGLNQITQAGSAALGYDSLGNLETGLNGWTYGYDHENRLRSATKPSETVSLDYDPLGMLRQLTHNGSTTEFIYDGPDLIAEYVGGSLVRRYVHGPGADQPLVWYEGSGTTDRRYLHADERGSIIAVSSGSGTQTYKYSPYGESDTPGPARFGYTGQLWLNQIGLYYYKARMYSPQVGRFLQPDPIGYAAGLNLYAYVSGDPINFADPSGLLENVDVWDCKNCPNYWFEYMWGFHLWSRYFNTLAETTPLPNPGGYSSGGGGAQPHGSQDLQQWVDEVVVTARRTRRLAGVRINFRLRYPLEQLWIVTNTGNIIYVPTKAETYTDSCGNTLGRNAPDGSVAIPSTDDIFALIHTHPSWGYAWPAAGDYTSAQNFSVYNINPSSAWVLREGAARGSPPVVLSGSTPSPPPSGRGATCR